MKLSRKMAFKDLNLKYKNNNDLTNRSLTFCVDLITLKLDCFVYDTFDDFLVSSNNVNYIKTHNDYVALSSYFNNYQQEVSVKKFKFKVNLIATALIDKRDLRVDLEKIKEQLRLMDNMPINDPNWNAARYNSLVNNRKSLISELKQINDMIAVYELSSEDVDEINKLYRERFGEEFVL